MVDAFRAAFVCTGNRFRSPLAAAVFERASGRHDVRATSFGCLDIGPMPPLAEAVKAALHLGLDLSGHRARALLLADLEPADLVVGFERVHRDTAIERAGARADRTFTLAELASLLEHEPAQSVGSGIERARSRVIRAHGMRATRSDGETSEITDPIGLPKREQEQIADEVERLTRRLSSLLFG